MVKILAVMLRWGCVLEKRLCHKESWRWWGRWVYHRKGGRVVLRVFFFGRFFSIFFYFFASAILLGVGVGGSITAREGGLCYVLFSLGAFLVFF